MLAELRLQQQTPEFRNRTGRLDKWKELSRAAQQQLEVELPEKDRLSYLVVASGWTLEG